MSDRLKWVVVLLLFSLSATALLVLPPLTPGQRVGGGAVLGGALLLALITQYWQRLGQGIARLDGTPWNDRQKAFVASLLTLGGGAVVVFVLVWITVKLSDGKAANDMVGVPLIVIVGVIVLLIVVSLVTFTYSALGLAHSTEALGLPDGSVRAIIALMLLVLFSIVSIFLYDNVANRGAIQSIENVTKEQLDVMRTQATIIVTEPPSGDGPFKVYYRATNPVSDDIAKQLIVLLGTLVTAVASFYFGSNAVASAHDAALGRRPDSAAAPKSASISPNPIRSGGGAQAVTVIGSNLSRITKLHFEQKGDADIDASNVNATDTTLTAQVKIPPGTKGIWNVVVDDDQKSIAIAQVQITD